MMHAQPVTEADRRRALERAYDASPKMLRLTAGQARAILAKKAHRPAPSPR